MAAEIPRPTRRCAVTGREIEPGEKFRSVLRATETGYERDDFIITEWSEIAVEPLAWWETRLAEANRSEPNGVEQRLYALLEDTNADERLRFAAASLLLTSQALKLHSVATE